MNINLTLIAQLISFAFFVWFTLRFVWPPLVKAMEDRKAKIADGLAAAERGAHEKELAEKAAAEKLHQAKLQSVEIIAKAEKRAAEIIEEAKNKAQLEGERLIQAAHAEIEQEKHKAKEALRNQVAELAVLGARKILQKEIDAQAHQDILQSLSKEI